jgi:hypothetical protein
LNFFRVCSNFSAPEFTVQSGASAAVAAVVCFPTTTSVHPLQVAVVNYNSKQQIGYKKGHTHPPQPPLPAGLAMRRSGLLAPAARTMNAMQMRVNHRFPIDCCLTLKTMFVHAFKHIALT